MLCHKLVNELLPRVIPILLLKGTGLVKGVQFKNFRYVGDPLNAVRIFNEKEVDELSILDITATKEGRIIPVQFVKKIASECMVPLMVGGGISSVNQAEALLAAGVEKIAINSHWLKSPSLITEIVKNFGSQSVVVSIDVKKNWFRGYEVYTCSGQARTKKKPIELAKMAESLGAGEILLTSIDRDGTCEGYDISLVSSVVNSVAIPVIAVGGAGKITDLQEVVTQTGCSAVGAGSFFIFHGRRKAVLISYPGRAEVKAIFEKNNKDLK